MGICQTKKQQRLIISRLKAFAKTMNLVGLTGGPQKPEALVKYEAQKAKQSRAAESGPGAPKAPLLAAPTRDHVANPAKAPQQLVPPGPALQFASPTEAKGSPPTPKLMETPAASPPPKAMDQFANCH